MNQVVIDYGEQAIDGLKQSNEEFRRRDRVIRIYPNRDAIVRLIGVRWMEIDEK